MAAALVWRFDYCRGLLYLRVMYKHREDAGAGPGRETPAVKPSGPGGFAARRVGLRIGWQEKGLQDLGSAVYGQAKVGRTWNDRHD